MPGACVRVRLPGQCTYQRRSRWLSRRRTPSTPIPKPGEAGFGPGEKGDSIEEGRENSQADDEKDDGDS